jgi:hypothetical protein
MPVADLGNLTAVGVLKKENSYFLASVPDPQRCDTDPPGFLSVQMNYGSDYSFPEPCFQEAKKINFSEILYYFLKALNCNFIFYRSIQHLLEWMEGSRSEAQIISSLDQGP